MSETTIAILILPVLIALTAVLECTRIGCTKLARHLRESRVQARVPNITRSEA